MWSQMGGTFPAPLFLFLAGISLAIVVDKFVSKAASPGQIARKTIGRGAEILALGLLFRLQEYVIAWGWAPWTDLFRVDILNCIGVSLMMMGAMCWIVLSIRTGGLMRKHEHRTDKEEHHLRSLVLSAVLVCASISALTPLLWTTWSPTFLPWELESYINGVHNLGQPQSWLFPIFPWAAFAFAGLATGFLLVNDSGKRLGAYTFVLAGTFGAALIFASKYFDGLRLQLYPIYDYWHTSPEFFALRAGMLLLLMASAYGWCRWGPGQWGFSPLIQLGKTSLIVYWVHIEFVYGRFSILPRKSNNVAIASVGLLTIVAAMLLLSWLRTKLGRVTLYKLTARPSHS